jgi:hypothetical protein
VRAVQFGGTPRSPLWERIDNLEEDPTRDQPINASRRNPTSSLYIIACVHVTLNSRSESLRVQVFGLPVATLIVAIDSPLFLLTKKATGCAGLRAPIPRVAIMLEVSMVRSVVDSIATYSY